MIATSPVVLATIDGSTPTERLQIVMAPGIEQTTRLELRQQSWSDSVGWYTQSSVAVEPEQVAELRNALGIGGASARLRPPQRSDDSPAARPLRIVG